MIRKILKALAIVVPALFVVIQLVPYRVHNPPVVQEPKWDSPQTRALAQRACFDCHSNEVVVPWYGYIAPVSWLLRDHVDEGRAVLNFSEMNVAQPEAHEAGETILEGEMPPAYYGPLHPAAQLTPEEVRLLVAGLNATLGGEGTAAEAGEDDDD